MCRRIDPSAGRACASDFDPLSALHRVSLMIHHRPAIALSFLVAMTCGQAFSAGPDELRAPEIRYLTFQVMTGLPGSAGPSPRPGRSSLDRGQIKSFVREVVHAAGSLGSPHRGAWMSTGLRPPPIARRRPLRSVSDGHGPKKHPEEARRIARSCSGRTARGRGFIRL